jgi:predicted secreted protein
MAEHATQAVIGHGSKLQRGGVLSTDPFSDVHECTDFKAPQAQRDKHEVSHYESPGQQKEKIAGMIENGTASATINWNPTIYADHASFRSDKNDGLLRYYKFIAPAAMETITFRASVTGLERNIPVNGPVTATITFEVNNTVEV